MSEEVKFTEEELKQIKSIQEEYYNVQLEYGNLTIIRNRLEKDLNIANENESNLNKKFEEIQDEEKKFLDEVTKKYGRGTLNPETGVFSKSK